MIQLWKLRREINRLGQQLKAIPEFIWEPAAQRRHNRAFEVGFPVHKGIQPLGKKVALLLIYQPYGIQKSILETCAYLQGQGFTLFIVANTPLTPLDLDNLYPHVWRVIERPNFGYDFGGYRDGIKTLWKWKVIPESLLVLNDSIWFPILPKQSLIHDLEQSQADITGTIPRRKGSIFFLESYCYLINKSTFSSAEFRQFWNQLRLTSNKYKVIRRGERGHSEAMIKADRKLIGLYPPQKFKSEIAKMNDDFLYKTVLYGAHTDGKIEKMRQLLLTQKTDSNWRSKVLTYIDHALERGQSYSSFPYAMINMFQYPILKKSNDHVAKLWRRAYLRGVDAGDIPAPSTSIMAEIRSKVKSDKL